VRQGVVETGARYPFIAYGFDWLAFAHIVLGILFLGAIRDPVRNIWVIVFGMIPLWLVRRACLQYESLVLNTEAAENAERNKG
jgi:hypothetical protein